MTVKEEIIALRQQIALAQRAYYVDSNPIMSDVEFDVLFDQFLLGYKEYRALVQNEAINKDFD